MSPLVSILTPTYEREPFLPLIYACVKSQSHENWEWLVYDDSSTPSAFMQNLSDPKVHYFHSTDRITVGTKTNLLADAAQGDILAHFDDDDYYAPKYIEDSVTELENRQADLVKLSGFFVFSRVYNLFSYCDLMIKTGRFYHWSAAPIRELILDENNNHEFEHMHLGYGFNYLYRRHVWEKYKFPDITWAADEEFVQAALATEKIALRPDHSGLCLHIMHTNNSSSIFVQYVIPDFIPFRLFKEIGSHWQAMTKI